MPIVHIAPQLSIVSSTPSSIVEHRNDSTAGAYSAHLQQLPPRLGASTAAKLVSLPSSDQTTESRQELHQRQARLPSCQQHESDPLDHRPDSPTSLEDSQSDSSIDSFSVDAVLSERPLSRFPNGSAADALLATPVSKDLALAMPEQYSMSICTNLVNGHTPMSPTQVATPPLSPVNEEQGHQQDQVDQEDEKVDRSSQRNDDVNESDARIDSTTTPAPMQSTRQSDAQKDKSSAQDSSLEHALTRENGGSRSSSDRSLTTTSPPPLVTAAEALTVPQPIDPAPLPKLSAWSTLLPGVAPIPAPKPQTPKSAARNPTARKSEEARLHERFPIVLAPECEAKLSMDMVDLFENLLPTEESHLRRTALVKKVENILHTEWPGQDFRAHPFGSTVNDLGTSSSDVDICIMTTWTGLKNVQMLANAFRKHGMQKVFCVPRAKVPIVKLWDPELHLSCDMNINTPLGLLNTKMIKTYVAIDPRVRPFAMIIKHWARRRVLNDAANGGTISTYTWICIVINFLQMRSPPILPKLHKMPHTLSEDNQAINGNNTSFCQDLAELEGFGLPNKETLGGLLYAFFRRFAIEFDYDHHVISVREGCYLTKEFKGWHLPGKQYKLFCVEEPFDTSRNLGNSSDMASSKGLKEEFKRALEILYNKVSLNECCEQFVFPASYYYSNNNTRKGSNGGLSYHNYAAGRRYANGYRTMHHYDDDDYDDDEEEEGEGDSLSDVSVMETLNIGTRPASSRDLTGGSKPSSGRNHGGGENGASTKYLNSNRDGASHHSGSSKPHDPSNRSRSRNRSKPSKSGEKEGGAGDSSRSGATRNGKQDKNGSGSVGSASSSSSGQRNKKSSSGGYGGGDRSKSGRGNNSNSNSSNGSGASGSGGRTPRATVEFSLADIANAAPKFLATHGKSDVESGAQGHGDASKGSGTGTEEGRSGGSGGNNNNNSSHNNHPNRNDKKGGRRNVVWSTNSNRGESSRRQGAARGAQQHPAEHEKGKVIFVAGDENGSKFSAGAGAGTRSGTGRSTASEVQA
ncbi:hypothetical protein BGZ98_001743 [Dissophora globulifera]|nr:hypothetical protein BGZ98_001743 [Dissophora globulifera]